MSVTPSDTIQTLEKTPFTNEYLEAPISSISVVVRGSNGTSAAHICDADEHSLPLAGNPSDFQEQFHAHGLPTVDVRVNRPNVQEGVSGFVNLNLADVCDDPATGKAILQTYHDGGREYIPLDENGEQMSVEDVNNLKNHCEM